MSVRYSLVIGNKNVSSWSLRPWLAMKMADIPFDEIPVPLYQPDTRARILAHSGSARVPILKFREDDEVRTVWDSLAICETLAERHPDARLWPMDANARAHARSISAEMHAGFPDLRRQLSMDISARHKTTELEDVTRRQLARIVELWTTALTDHPDGGFLFGHFTIADAFYAPVVTRFVTYGVSFPEACATYCGHIRSLAPMREWEEAANAEVAARPDKRAD